MKQTEWLRKLFTPSQKNRRNVIRTKLRQLEDAVSNYRELKVKRLRQNSVQ
jgi:hypothetical protein